MAEPRPMVDIIDRSASRRGEVDGARFSSAAITQQLNTYRATVRASFADASAWGPSLGEAPNRFGSSIACPVTFSRG